MPLVLPAHRNQRLVSGRINGEMSLRRGGSGCPPSFGPTVGGLLVRDQDFHRSGNWLTISAAVWVCQDTTACDQLVVCRPFIELAAQLSSTLVFPPRPRHPLQSSTKIYFFYPYVVRYASSLQLEMSRASKLTLAGTSLMTAGIVVFVHYAQQAEKAVSIIPGGDDYRVLWYPAYR